MPDFPGFQFHLPTSTIVQSLFSRRCFFGALKVRTPKFKLEMFRRSAGYPLSAIRIGFAFCLGGDMVLGVATLSGAIGLRVFLCLLTNFECLNEAYPFALKVGY